MARFGLPCSDWGRRGLSSWKFAASATAALRRPSARPVPPMSRSCARALERQFPDFKIVRLTTGMDLEKSFGPVYARGLMRARPLRFAVLGVNAQETQSSIDAALTFGILWLDVCRQSQAANVLVEGLKFFVPRGTSALVRERMANLNRERREVVTCSNWTNAMTHWWKSIVPIAAMWRRGWCTPPTKRGARAVSQIRLREFKRFCPNCEVADCSRPRKLRFGGVDWSLRGPGWACIPGSFRSTEEIVFGVGRGRASSGSSNEA